MFTWVTSILFIGLLSQASAQSFDKTLPNQQLAVFIKGKQTPVTAQELLRLNKDLLRLRQRQLLQNEGKIKMGGADSGGGSSVAVHNKRVLLDFTLCNEELFSTKKTGDTINITSAMKEVHLDKVDAQNLSSYQKAKKYAQSWVKSSPYISENLMRSLNYLPIYSTDLRFLRKNPEVYIPEERASLHESLVTIGLFENNFGLIISSPAFNELDENSQIGFFIHEGLRRLQIFHGLKFNNQWLQQTTCRLMREPQDGESLDDLESMDDALKEDYFQTYLSPKYFYYGVSYLLNVLATIDSEQFEAMKEYNIEVANKEWQKIMSLGWDCQSHKRQENVCEIYDRSEDLISSLHELYSIANIGAFTSKVRYLIDGSDDLSRDLKTTLGLDGFLRCLNSEHCEQGFTSKEKAKIRKFMESR